MNRLGRLTPALAMLLLTGCVNFDLPGFRNVSPVVYYVLEDAGRPPSSPLPSPHTLILVDTLTANFYDNDGMAFSKESGTRGYYKYARWTERPGKRFTDLLISRLEQEKLFVAVAQTGTNVHGDWLLTTEIVELYHNAVKEPGAVNIVLRAEVTDLNSRTLISRKLIAQSVPVPRYEAGGAHEAFNQAVTLTLNQLADWLKVLSGKSESAIVKPS
jgi:cholesterol transport system auxiliary component